jgi:queuine tRNA-ribosyltransferase
VTFHFELLQGDAQSARLGRLHTPHGSVQTPAFMPVATRGMMRGILPQQLRTMGVDMALCNSFHLYARPGVEIVQKLGGVHGMLAWDGPILTDSGGFQVFSLGALNKVHKDGVEVDHPVHGGKINWTPKLAFETQTGLAPDVAMLLDICPDKPLDQKICADAVERTVEWARVQRDLHDQRGGASSGQAQFAIVQGGVFSDLREQCAKQLVEMEFDGYAIGGVSVGEGHDAMMKGVEHSCPYLPPQQARYLMGVGTPQDLVEGVARGIDMFDCVFPARAGRFGTALTDQGRLHLLNAKFKDDARPIDPECDCEACLSKVPRGALRAGFKAKELLPPILVSLHNLHYIQKLMQRMRTAIADGSFEQLRMKILRSYLPERLAELERNA